MILFLAYLPGFLVATIVPEWLIPVAVMAPIVLGVAIVLMWRLLLAVSDPVPVPAAVIGIVFIVGGTAFDMLATVLHSPTLESEGNAIARAFLEAAYPLWFLYGFSILAQALDSALLSLAWVAFLRHRRALIASIGHPKTLDELMNLAFGMQPRTFSSTGKPASWTQPRAYHILWFAIVLLVALQGYRWYLGLEWFDVVEGFRWLVVAIITLQASTVYFSWLWWASRANSCAPKLEHRKTDEVHGTA